MAAAVLLFAIGFGAPAEARWLRAESPRLIVYSDGSESVLRQYVDLMETFDSLLRARHGLPETGTPNRKLPIYLVRSREDLQLTWNKAGGGVAGYYSPGTADTFAVATMEARGEDTALLHEYVHHFMLGYFPGAYPAWMVEGYAEYYGQTEIKNGFVEVGQVAEWRSSQLLNRKWMSTRDLLANKRGRDDSSAFYAQSWLLTHYLMSDPDRFRQFQAYASAVGKGADPVKAMQDATGQTPEDLEKTLRRYMASGLKIIQYKQTAFSKPPITITTLPPSADDLLLERIQIVAKAAKDADPGYLAMIQRRAAKYPGDQLALLALSQAEMELGDHAKGRSLLEAWLKDHPDDVEAMYVLGTHLFYDALEREDEDEDDSNAEDGKAQEKAPPGIKDPAMLADAQTWLKKAATLAPNDYRVLYAYARTRRGESDYPSQEVQEVLIRAYRQAPQVVPLRFELVQVLIARRHPREARALLQPLLNSPHGGAVVEAAKSLLKRIEALEARAQAG